MASTQDIYDMWVSYKNGNIQHAVNNYIENSYELCDIENALSENGYDELDYEDIAYFLNMIIRNK